MAKVSIDVYSNMYNEELVLPYWLRHYETFADRIFVWDDDSTDKTREILGKHPKVTLLPRERHGLDDAYFVNTLYPQYEKYSRGISDWVIVADGDEFIYHPHIREVLADPKVQARKIIHCAGFAMISEGPPTTTGQIYDEIKMGVRDLKESKWTIHSSNIQIRHKYGRHGPPANFYQFRGDRNTGIKSLHYRLLGEDYIESLDRSNLKRVQLAHPHIKREFRRDELRRCPDGDTTMNTYEWLAKHKGEAFNVLEV